MEAVMVSGLPADFRWAPLVPELLVSNLPRSIAFWCGHVGFSVAYERPEEGFAYLVLNGAQIMLEQQNDASRNWLTGPLEQPLGRGINFQIEASDLLKIRQSLKLAAWPLFMDLEEKWYRVSDHERGQAQFLVQDPDGYLLRLVSPVGVRQLGSGDSAIAQ
jgi:catechol 2,3-dioxygenase-like lactoylglutathione lyase family enzyme